MSNTAITTKDEIHYGNDIQTITTLEIAEMMNIEHWQVLRKLEGTKDSKGIIQILNDNKIVVDDYFKQSSYIDSKGEARTCYDVTKMGCDFLANKFTGEKGILFTAKYVKKFDEMQKIILKTNDNTLLGLQCVKFIADDLRVAESSRLFMYENYCKDVGIPTGFLPKYEDNGNRGRKQLRNYLKKMVAI